VSDPKIVASAREQTRRPAEAADPSRAWGVLGWVGLTFLLVGGTDFALVWVPTAFGNREWVFAAVTQSFNGLPILVLGLGLLVAASAHAERPGWRRLAVGVAGVLLAWVLAGTALWASNVSLALATVPDEVRVGVQKAVAKTAVQAVAYPVVLGYLLWRGWRAGLAGLA
jgi:hypothetical protein